MTGRMPRAADRLTSIRDFLTWKRAVERLLSQFDARIAGCDTGDADVVAGDLAAHEALTTAVHGIADTGLLETLAGAQAKADAAQAAAEVTAADGSNITSGTVADARIASTIARDSEVAAAYQPLHAILTDLAAQTIAADTLVYGDGADSFATTGLTAAARAMLDDVDNPAIRATIAAADRRPVVNAQTGTSYTLVLTDESKVIQVNNAGTHTLTVPANGSVAFTTGTMIEIFRQGAGAVTIAPDTGVTINSRAGLLGVDGQYGVVRLRKRAADIWVLSGDLA